MAELRWMERGDAIWMSEVVCIEDFRPCFFIRIEFVRLKHFIVRKILSIFADRMKTRRNQYRISFFIPSLWGEVRVGLLLLFLLFPFFSVAQETLFRVPFDFPLYLSGSFAELRSNHFHGGVDFKTQGVEGKPLYCPADGYISRISVAPGGYGNALYITHDNGYTTVHGHLQKFLPEVASLVREHQYQYETFALDTLLASDRFPVKRGQLVAWAGNSGYSFGPHLHMEVRLTETNEPVDPLVFYKDKLKDTRPPRAHRIKIYPQKGRGVVNGKEETPVFYFGNGNRVNQQITAWGEIGIGLSANDYMDGTHNTYGVKSVRLLVDGVEVFNSETDRFSFDENRLINSWTDYNEYQKHRRWYMKSFIAPGNPLRMLSAEGEGRGIVSITEERPYHFEYILSDLYGNTSKYRFEVRGVQASLKSTSSHDCSFLKYNKTNTVTHQAGMELTIPQGMLYENTELHVKSSADAYAYSPIFTLGEEVIPLHGYCPIAIKVWPDESHLVCTLSEGLSCFSAWPTLAHPYADKLYVAQRRGGWTGSVGGRYEKGWMKANVRELGGEFFVAIDTIPPVLTPVSPAIWSKTGVVRIKIADSQTGITKYRATVDGRWTLMEYSSKNRILTVRLSDSPLAKEGAQHTLRITVMDGVGNTSVHECVVRW